MNIVSPVSGQDHVDGGQRAGQRGAHAQQKKIVSRRGVKKMAYNVAMPTGMMTMDIMNRKNFKLDDGKLEDDDPTMEPRLAQSMNDHLGSNEATQPNDTMRSSTKARNMDGNQRGGSKMKMSNLSKKLNASAMRREPAIDDKDEALKKQQLQMMQPPFKPLVEMRMSQMGSKTFLDKIAEDKRKLEHESSLSTQDIERKIELLQLQQQQPLQGFGNILQRSGPMQSTNTILTKEDKVIANETAKFKFNMNYGPQNQKSISSSAGAGNLQNSPQKIKAIHMNNSIVSLNGGKVPTGYDSSRLISQAVLRDQTQSQLDMQIKSSKAFDVNQHLTLLEIIQKVEKSAKFKHKIDLEKQANNEKLIKGKSKSRNTQQIGLTKAGSSLDQHKNTKSRLQPFTSLDYNNDGEKIGGMTIRSNYKAKVFARTEQRTQNEPMRSKSTTQGGHTADGKLKNFGMLNQNTLPNIYGKLSKNQGHGVNSYNYLKSQWLDIKIQSNDRRRFIRDFAKRQIEPSAINQAIAQSSPTNSSFLNTKRQSHVPSKGQTLDPDARGIDDTYGVSRFHRKAVKPNVDAAQVKPQILQGFENNRQLLTDMRMAEKRKQELKTTKEQMLDSSLVFPEIKRELNTRKKSTYHELQRYFDRPKVSTRSIENHNGKDFIKISKRDKSQNVTQQDSKESNQDSDFEEVHKDLVGQKINQENLDKVYLNDSQQQKSLIKKFTDKFQSQYSPIGQLRNEKIQEYDLSPDQVREQNIKKYNHLKILDIKEQLRALLMKHLKNTPKYVLLNDGVQDHFSITKNEVHYLFELDAMDYRQGRNSQMLKESQDDSMERTHSNEGQNSKDSLNPQTGKNKKVRTLALLPTCIVNQQHKQEDEERNFIQEALEELPESQLLKLVEILFEEPRGQINIYKNMQKRESRMGQYLGIESVQNQNSISQFDLNQNSQMRIGDSMANITNNMMESHANLMSSQMMGPVQFKIDAYQNKIQLNMQRSKESLMDLSNIYAQQQNLNRSQMTTKHHTFNPGFNMQQQQEEEPKQNEQRDIPPNKLPIRRIGSIESVMKVVDDQNIPDDDLNEYDRDGPSVEMSSVPKDSSISSRRNQRHFTEQRPAQKKSPFKVAEQQPPAQTPHMNILNQISFNNRQVFSPALSPYQVSENDLRIKYNEQDVLIEEAKDKKGILPKPLLDKNSFWNQISKISELKKKEQKLVIYRSILGINEWYQTDGQYTPQYQTKTLTSEQLAEVQTRKFSAIENKTVSDILKRINEQIIDIRQMINPIFSGNLGENIKRNSENLMMLFKNLPSSDQLYKQRIDEETEELTKSLDIDVFDEDKKSLLDSMQEDMKIKNNAEGDRSSSSNNSPTMQQRANQASQMSLILSESGGPENEQQQQKMKKFIAQMQNLTVKEMDFYNLMVKMYEGNREIQKEFEKMRYQNRVKIDFKSFNLDQKRQQFVNIDLQKMAKQYQSGTYYLMKVINYKLQELKIQAQIGLQTARTVRFASQKKESNPQPEPEEMYNQLKSSLAKLSPFSKIEEQNQIVEDSNYIVPVMINHIDFTTGQRPCSRKNFGCCWVNGRLYMLGGSAYTLLNDLKSFSFSTLSWRSEDMLSLESPTSKPNSPREKEKSRFEQDQKELTQIQKRFGFSMNSFMDRFIVVFGGAGNYMSKLKRRETFDDLQIWDAHNSEMYQQSLLKRGKDDSDYEPSKWIDMNDQGQISPVSPKKFQVMFHARFDKTAYTGGINRDIADAGPPTRRCYHAAEVYGGCLVVQGGVYCEDNRALDDFALYDIALGMWIDFKQPKLNRAANYLGPRSYHTMTSVQDPNVSLSKRNTRLMWLYEPNALIEGVGESRSKKRQTFFKTSGIFIFGGLKGHLTVTDPRTMAQRKGRRKPQNDLYLIRPCYRRNQKYLTRESAQYKKGIETKICFEVQKLNPVGKPPIPRYAHAACFIKNYLVIHGGRNDEIYSSLGNVALNDLHLYDINLNQWLAVAIYGYAPISRWGHKIQAEQTAQQDYQGSRMIIFGGINLKSFCDTAVHEVVFDSIRLLDFLDQNESNITQLIREGQRQLRDIDGRM